MARIMRKVTVTGVSRGRDVYVQWRAPGELTGDPFVIADIEDLVASGREVGHAGLAVGPATLNADDGPDLVVATLTAVLDEVRAVEGLEPDAVPAGADA